MSFRFAARCDELAPGEMLHCEIQGRPVLLVALGGSIVALEDRCAHLGLRLSEGFLEGTTLTCAAHRWTYDVTCGRGVNPSTACLTRFSVRVDQQRILVDVESPGNPT